MSPTAPESIGSVKQGPAVGEARSLDGELGTGPGQMVKLWRDSLYQGKDFDFPLVSGTSEESRVWVGKLGVVQVKGFDFQVAGVAVWSYLDSADIAQGADFDGGIVAFAVDSFALVDHVVFGNGSLDLFAVNENSDAVG